ncbi:MAG: hypothetical protein FJ100_12630 [Deltaproteobacteria bacterium]|nr:hypothetical protein [Deltaproteobacteria bacterium]
MKNLLILPALFAPLVAFAAPPVDKSAARLRTLEATPYRLEVATSDGSKVLVTDMLTLERRRVHEAPGLAALAFSPGGQWLYAVGAQGLVTAIDPDKAKASQVAQVAIKPGEAVVDVVGLGPLDQWAVAVVVATGIPSPTGRCTAWRNPRRVVVRKAIDGREPAVVESKDGWPDDQRVPRLAAISPNTRYRAQVMGPVIQNEGRFGAASGQITRTALPTGVFALQWMHDSAGLGVVHAKKPLNGCMARSGLRVLRDDGPAKPGWDEWNLPDAVELVRGDQPWLAPLPTDDAMHWVGVEARGVVLVEPVPRFRGKLALVAPPSALWPKVRPGTRPQASLVGGPARLTELLMETGDLDAAEDELARLEGRTPPAAIAKLRARLDKLVDVRGRRAAELGVALDEMRSKKGLPAPKPLPAKATDTDAVEPANAPTPSGP